MTISAMLEGMNDEQDAGTNPQTTEAAPPVEAPKEQAPDPMASRLAMLSKRDREIREREKKIKDMEKSFSEREKDWKEFNEIKKLGGVSKLKAMEKLGWNYEDISNEVMNTRGAPPDDRLLSVMEEVKELKNLLTQRETEAATKQKDSVIENFKKELSDFIDKSGEKYELIKGNDAQEMVFDLIDAYYNSHGKILSNDEACEMIEKELDAKLDKLLQLNKIKSKLVPKTQDQTETPPQKLTARTLTNDMSSLVPPRKSAYNEAEARKRAEALLKYVE